MKRILLSILAIFFPWMVLLMDEKPIAAVGCIALQLTFIGWLPATIWAWGVAKRLSKTSHPTNVESPTSPNNVQNNVINPEELKSDNKTPTEKVQTTQIPQAEQLNQNQPNKE